MSATAPTAQAQAKQLKPFALGTTLYPTPISGLGGPLAYTPNGQSTLTPIPKTGFLGRLRFNMSGTVQFSTVATAAYEVPFWKILQNYSLVNSLNYPYRSLSGDDFWFWQQISTPTGGGVCGSLQAGDPVTGSNTYEPADATLGTLQTWSVSLTDEIWNNNGVNFSRYLLSAMTTSNDITINITWSNAIALQQNGAVIGAFTAAIQVSAEFLTVPDPRQYAWPRRNLVQQILGDPSYNSPKPGLNAINLTPIQGPEFTGLGICVKDAGVPDPLMTGLSNIQSVQILVNGTIPLYYYTLNDMIVNYERTFRRSPKYGYLYLDFMNDLGLVNSMSHTHRKVLSTAKYSQITVQVNLAPSFSGAAGSVINLFKRTQQMYSNNG